MTKEKTFLYRLRVDRQIELLRMRKKNLGTTEKIIELLEKYLLDNNKSSFKDLLEQHLFFNNYSNLFYDRLFNLDPSDKKSIINKISNWFKNFSVEGLRVISIDLEKYLMK